MIARTLLMQFRQNHVTIRLNCEGLSQMESLFQPLPEGNCLNWVLGHILACRIDILELLEADPVWDEDRARPYQSGSPPITADGDQVVTLERMLADLERTQDILIQRLERLDDEKMAEELEGRPRGEWLAGYQLHEAYHAGQLGVLRRIAGKPGALEEPE